MDRQSFGLSPLLALALASAFWGVGTVLSKELLGTVPPVLFLIIQLVPSVIALWAIFFLTGTRPKGLQGLFPIMALGLLNPGLSYALSMIGLVHTTASVATLVWAAEPALIVILAGIILCERISPALIACTIAAAIGVLLASGITDIDSGIAQNQVWVGVIFLGVMCCAIYTVFSRRILANFHPLFVVALQQTVALVWVISIWPFEAKGQGIQQLIGLSSAEWLVGALTGLMYYAFAYWLYLIGLRSIAASRAASFLSLIPLFGIAAAYLFLGERLSTLQWLGACMILAAVLTIQITENRARISFALKE
jgi:drug/metabolite transporter (DMT)-like permease